MSDATNSDPNEDLVLAAEDAAESADESLAEMAEVDSSPSDASVTQDAPREGFTNPQGYWGGVSYAERNERMSAMMKSHGSRKGRGRR